MARVKNTTASHISVDVEGKRHRIAPGKTASVTPREALILGEYDGIEIDGDYSAVVRAQDVPVTEGETRHTGGRQHVIDDPRQNEPGTPVTETGDTGSTTPEPGVQGVSAAEHAAGAENEVRTPEQGGPTDTVDVSWVDELQGENLDAALTAAGLTTTGKVEAKRARLREHHTTPAS